jgi:NADPH:quinone reductase-like Zn-dependent oxidoreductase
MKESREMQATTSQTPAEKSAPLAETYSPTMRSSVQREYGSSATLQLEDLATPEAAADQVLVEVHAAGIDRGVWHLMTGMPYIVRALGYGLTLPKNPTPGADVAGRVVAVGKDVTRFTIGDEIFGIAEGSYAEYAVADESKIAHKPESISYEQAAVASISGITALQALTDIGGLEAGQDVLVIGASGGVGSYAVQLAKALGATVTGVASGAKADVVRSLGADDVIDYAGPEYLDGSRTFDLIVDIGGRNPVSKLRNALTSSGTLVIVGGEGGGKWTGGMGRQLKASLLSPFVSQRLVMFISKEHHSHIERLAGFIDRGEVTPTVGRSYPLDQVPAAIDDLVAGRIEAKSVIVVR